MLSQAVGKEILSIFDLPQNKFYVGISELLEIKLNTKISAISKSFNEFLSKNNIATSSYRWFEKREFPLIELIRLAKLLKIKEKEIEKSITYVRSGRYPLEKVGGCLGEKVFLDFPLRLTNELTRIIAHIFADGCISIDKNSYVTGAYYNQSVFLRNEFKKDIENVFKFYSLKEKKNKGTEYFYLSSSISLILLLLAKTYSSKECRVPNFIKNAADKIKCEFLGAIFDDECCVNFRPPYRHIELSLCNFGLLTDIQIMLSEFDIKSTKICHRKLRNFDLFSFYIRGIDNFLIFKKLIGFTDIPKSKKLEKIISNPGRYSRTARETSEKIISILKRKNANTHEISRKINRSYPTANAALNKLKLMNIANNRIKNKKIVWYLE